MSNTPAAGEAAMAFEGVSKVANGRLLVADVSLAMRRGETVVIFAKPGASRKMLMRLFSGQVHPTHGRRYFAGPPAPPPGTGWGFLRGVSLLRSLEVRARLHGVDHGAYVATIAALMEDPTALRQPFGALTGHDRAIVSFASSWLLPSAVYVCDPRPAPPDEALRRRIEPLWRAASERAAVVWLANPQMKVDAAKPDRILRLDGPRLAPA